MSNHDISKDEDRRLRGGDADLKLLTVISSPGKASSMAQFALEEGALTAYHCYAHGTVPGHLLSLLGLSGVRRELVSITLPASKSQALMDRLCQHFKIGSDMNGIAFLSSFETEGRSDFSMIAAVVNEGEGEDVVDSARRCQPVGATILKGLGTADHSHKSFDFEIIPQKELVLIISRSCQSTVLFEAIYQAMRTEKPGRGILFAFDLDRVEGILDMTPECEDDPSLVPPQSPASAPPDLDLVALTAVTGRGHTREIVATMEAKGGTGATILHCRKTDAASKGWYSRLGDEEKEIVIILTQRPVARAIKADLIEKLGSDESGPLVISQLKVTQFKKLSEAL